MVRDGGFCAAFRGELRMRAFLRCLSLGFVLAGHAAFAQTVTGAQMTWYGNYTVERVTEQKDSGSATGTKNVIGGIVAPAADSDVIRAVPGTRFGFGYRLIGPSSDAVATVRHVYKMPPPGIADATGQRKVADESTYPDLGLDRKDLFIGRYIAGDFPTGTWTLQLWYRDRMLAEKSFTVVAP
jgi:hypothetical protein